MKYKSYGRNSHTLVIKKELYSWSDTIIAVVYLTDWCMFSFPILPHSNTDRNSVNTPSPARALSTHGSTPRPHMLAPRKRIASAARISNQSACIVPFATPAHWSKLHGLNRQNSTVARGLGRATRGRHNAVVSYCDSVARLCGDGSFSVSWLIRNRWITEQYLRLTGDHGVVFDQHSIQSSTRAGAEENGTGGD